ILGRDTLMRTYPQLRIDPLGDRQMSPAARRRSLRANARAKDKDPSSKVTGAIYSPQDLQVNPVSLAMALIEAATLQGAVFHWGWPVQGWHSRSQGDRDQVYSVDTSRDRIACDGVIITAGLGSSLLAKRLGYDLPQRPVLGQAVHLKLPRSLTLSEPVIIGHDTNIVPLDKGNYWVGATVEFGDDDREPVGSEEQLNQMLQGVYDLYPRLQDADVLRTWSGTRPRPQNRPAPVIEALADYNNVILATAHYRNGVLLAPATAERVKQLLYELAIA
ncbi:MAG: FAD-dependent oxidoreductase, partial [Cyanobacteria bacterium P01_H01_bin.130]